VTDGTSPKLLPRNVAALRKGQDPGRSPRAIVGNPMPTRLESGIGNCFPGLECDLRNLERRFFPFLEIEIGTNQMQVVGVVLDGVNDALARREISDDDARKYQRISDGLQQGASWSVGTITGNFGPFGQLSFSPSALTGVSTGDGRLPPEAWAAARTLVEASVVTLTLVRDPRSDQDPISLSGARARYLDDNGALARIFEPGELTQSLCSPWTHDFRDCACFYWASNHPDIALPPLPKPAPPAEDERWRMATAWERANRSTEIPPVAQRTGPRAVPEIPHHTINRDWQQLNFVLERREQLGPYAPGTFTAQPFPDRATLIDQLRYAAGVELAVMQQYLTAAWSLRPANGAPEPLASDLKAAFAELRRIAISEMRHLRAVNDVLAALSPPENFQPALRVASKLPDPDGTFRPVLPRAATLPVLDNFIAIEAPSQSVDGLYGRILATLEQSHENQDQQQTIRKVMAEGEDHYETFLAVKEWLGRHQTNTYLRSNNLAPAPANNPAHQQLQQRYVALLDHLYKGYSQGIPKGAGEINAARASMLGPGGMEGALDAVAAQTLLIVFDPVPDPRFAAIDPPQ
jgi:hypothetical protein